jgi:hypothetical protein
MLLPLEEPEYQRLLLQNKGSGARLAESANAGAPMLRRSKRTRSTARVRPLYRVKTLGRQPPKLIGGRLTVA